MPIRGAHRSCRIASAALATAFATGLAPTVAAAQGLFVFRAQMWDQDLLQVPDGAEPDDQLGEAAASGDFDGDGCDDLAIGVPKESLDPGGEILGAGTVLVIYGTASGLGLGRAQFWHQDSPGIQESAEFGDRFGTALAAGDFNADGYDDLAVGAFHEDGTTGIVHVIPGSPTGLTATGDQLWSQGTLGVPGEPLPGDLFGYSLATGDFDGDGYDDLAIGAPGDQFVNCDACGGVNLLFGSEAGLTTGGTQYLEAEAFGSAYDDFDNFGGSLAAGDFDGDGFEDLAIGTRYDDFLDVLSVGSVRVIFGSDVGLDLDRDLYLLGPEAFGHQGSALAAGDFDGDGDDDLAIGIPGRTVGGNVIAGAVALRLGDGGALADGGEWSQDTAGVQGVAEPSDAFGATLAAGDFDGDGRADLAVGVPLENVIEINDGAVNVLYGAANGLTAAADQLWTRGAIPVVDPSLSENQDELGGSLAVGDFDGTGHADLAIGAPGEALTVGERAGALFVLHGALFADDFESGDTAAWSDAVG